MKGNGSIQIYFCKLCLAEWDKATYENRSSQKFNATNPTTLKTNVLTYKTTELIGHS